MYKSENNYAFIDIQNVYRGAKEIGFIIDWKKFRVYIKEKYSVHKAFVFISYIESNSKFYNFLQNVGYNLILKPVSFDENRKIKGNCDGDMILQAITEINKYDKAIIITSDGDFYSLVRFLYQNKKLKVVLCPNIKKCSKLLRK